MIYSRLDEVNVCDVGGPGSGATRPYTSRTSGTENDSPWARRAVYRQARRGNSAGEREDAGDQALNKQRAKRTLNFTARQTEATRYGRDWGLGDLVTVEFLGRSYDKKVVGITVGLGASDESIRVETEDA